MINKDTIIKLATDAGMFTGNGYYVTVNLAIAERFAQSIYKLGLEDAAKEAKLQTWTACAEKMPDHETIVLAYYKNDHGFSRRIRAKWVKAKTSEASPENEFGEYDEESDCYYCPEGWYECINNWDEYSAVQVYEGKITHWRPLPPPPIDTAIRALGGQNG